MDIGVLPSESLSSFMSRRVKDVSLKKKELVVVLKGIMHNCQKKDTLSLNK